MVTVPMVVIAARPMSGASGNTSVGLLPPSSRDTRLSVPADAATIRLPTPRLPVKLILSTSGCVISASPVGSPGPVTTLTTPSGMPASASSSTMRSTENDANSDGFSTTVQPAASAGASFCANSRNGAFHGRIAATTPIGSRNVIARWSPPWYGGSVWPPTLSIQPAWWSNTSAAAPTDVA